MNSDKTADPIKV